MPKLIDLTGHRFHSWTVLGRSTTKHVGAALWACRCDCGSQADVNGKTLRRGTSKSCGCYRYKVMKTLHRTHGLSGHPNYYIWHMMRARCYDKSSGEFKNYGGRGITMCDAWRNSLHAFIDDMGARPSKRHTIDRIDNDGPYSRENCRWATVREQCNNTRRNVMIEFNGLRLSSTQWSNRLGGRKHLVKNRLKYGWPIDRAVTEPIHPHVKKSR